MFNFALDTAYWLSFSHAINQAIENISQQYVQEARQGLVFMRQMLNMQFFLRLYE